MPGGKGQAQGLTLPCGVGGWACWVGLGRHKACPCRAGCVVGIGRRDWAGTRPAPTVRSGWLGLVGGIGQAQGLPLRCGVGGWDWVAGRGQAQGLPLPCGVGGWDWSAGRGQARGLPLPCGVGGWDWVAGRGQAQGLPLPCGVGGWELMRGGTRAGTRPAPKMEVGAMEMAGREGGHSRQDGSEHSWLARTMAHDYGAGFGGGRCGGSPPGQGKAGC